MSDTTRRAFVKRSAAAAAGMTVVGAIVAEEADAKVAARSGAVVAYINHPANGEIEVMSGERQVKLHDRKLAAKLARAAHEKAPSKAHPKPTAKPHPKASGKAHPKASGKAHHKAH